MSAPNIVNVATITAKTFYDALADTNLTSLVLNAASSGKVIKINSLTAANVDGTNACNVNGHRSSRRDVGGDQQRHGSIHGRKLRPGYKSKCG